MRKYVPAKSIRQGDRIRLQDGTEPEVLKRRSVPGDGPVRLILEGRPGSQLCLDPDDPICLVHRPWPEGKTESDMLGRVSDYAWAVSRTCGRQKRPNETGRELIDRLYEAIQSLYLGMPRSGEPPTAMPVSSPEPIKGTSW